MQLENIIEKSGVNPDIVLMEFGSKLYGLSTPESDTDYYGIYLPSIEQVITSDFPKSIVLKSGSNSCKNTSKDIDYTVTSLHKFIQDSAKGETYALDMLHCNRPTGSPALSWVWEDMVRNRAKFYSKDMKAYAGYVKKQAAKYGLKGSRLADIKKALKFLERANKAFEVGSSLSDIDRKYFPQGEYLGFTKYIPKNKNLGEQEFWKVNSKKYQLTNTIEYVLEQVQNMWDSYGIRAKLAERNEGVDWKAISHALRVGYQLRDIHLNGDFEYPLKETEYLKAVKRGELDYKSDVSVKLEELVAEVDKLAYNSTLPKKVDNVRWQKWLIDVYKEVYPSL